MLAAGLGPVIEVVLPNGRVLRLPEGVVRGPLLSLTRSRACAMSAQRDAPAAELAEVCSSTPSAVENHVIVSSPAATGSSVGYL
jgi:hypothetical protein